MQADKQFFSKLSKGQSPKTLVVGCADSRVDPATLFDTQLGELFIIRNVANLIPPYAPDAPKTDNQAHGVAAAIEYAVQELQLDHIVILGHAFCGGIAALCKICQHEQTQGASTSHHEFIPRWIDLARPALKQIDLRTLTPDTTRQAEQHAIRHSMQNLLSFPFVAEKVNAQTLSIHGWWFDMGKGDLWGWDESKNQFMPLKV